MAVTTNERYNAHADVRLRIQKSLRKHGLSLCHGIEFQPEQSFGLLIGLFEGFR
jgi:hypothetical protein